MPRRFLSRAERQRLSRFPDEVTDADCVVYFTLTPADKALVESKRGDANRMGVAVLLCSLRYLGYFPANIQHPPRNIAMFLAEQVEASAQDLAEYADRDQTRREHLTEVMKHLGFRRLRPQDRQALITWLGERALEHERPATLLQQACEHLYQLRLVRPAITTMEEVVADARQWAEQKTIAVLVQSLPEEVRTRLDTLLTPHETQGRTPLVWLRRFATGHSDRDILATLAKLTFIRQWPITSWHVEELPASRISDLAQIARSSSVPSLASAHRVPRQFHHAAALLAAADALRTMMGLHLAPLEQTLYAETLAAAHAALGEENYAAAWAEGQALSLDEAVALAMALPAPGESTVR